MSKTYEFLLHFCLQSLVCVALSASVFAQKDESRPIPKEVQQILGNYKGAWTSFGLNEKGEVVKQASWTDVIKAENPVFSGDRVSVTTNDEMTFEGGKIPPMKIQSKEGFFINGDGVLGDYFIETFGQTYRLQKLNEAARAYAAVASPREYSMLGKVNIVSAQHVLVKVVTFENGIETHSISRVTTVEWKDVAGALRTTQFVSLQGRHQRVP
jgi:hypothetical protein